MPDQIDQPYFTVDEARLIPELADADRYPDITIEEARTGAEQALEDACGIAFAIRNADEDHRPDNRGEVLLRPAVREITSITSAGASLFTDLSQAVVTRSGLLVYPCLTPGRLVTVTYTHGRAAIPYRVKRAALMLVKSWLSDRTVDDRATRVQIEGGDMYFSTGQGEPFNLPEVNAVVRAYTFGSGLL